MEYSLFAESEIVKGAMRAVVVAGRAMLVARVAGRCHAIDATCPHAGAPLSEGVLHEGTVICPWHKAAFDLATGKCQAPPAVDDLLHYPIRTVDGQLRVAVAPPVAPRAMQGPLQPGCIAVVGAGAAGFAAAQTLREEGFDGRLVLVNPEARLPYDRTVLSKYALSGKKGGEKSPLQDDGFFTRQRIEQVAQPVTALDAATRTITFADGGQLRYDQALVATGGTPRRPGFAGADLPGVHVLRSPSDVAAILASAEGARRAVVIGAGFIGLEAAASLRERGLDVAVVAPQQTPLQGPLGPEIGHVFQQVHAREGVVFHLGQEVAAIEGEARVAQVRLKTGTILPADLVVAGLGITPATGFLHGVAVRPDHGIAVDARLQAADGLYAAGDIAAFPLYGDGSAIRVEHWRVAQQHGRIAALNMLGEAVPFTAVPYFWTIHYMRRLDYVGHAEAWDEVVIDGDLEEPNFLAFYMKDAVVQAVAGWGRDVQMATAIPLMEAQRNLPLDALRRALG